MRISYTDLVQHQECPRKFAFVKLGYEPLETSSPLLTGGLAHIGISAYYRRQDWQDAIGVAARENLARLNSISDTERRHKAQEVALRSYERAVQLTTRYVEHWAKDYLAQVVEPVLEQPASNVIAHPDMFANYQGQRVIVDFKTSHSPDVRYYDMSGQVDFYAFFAELLAFESFSLISYDCISDEGIFRHMRPPRLDAGERIYKRLCNLSDEVNSEGVERVLLEPHIRFNCPNSCSFFLACLLMETQDWSACIDYLDRNFVKKERIKDDKS